MSAAHRGGYTHLVLSAAGFRAFTFLGALQALRDADMHRSVRHVAGCSGGAIAAFAFCLDLDPQHVAARCAASVADPARGAHVVGTVRLGALAEMWDAQGVAQPGNVERLLRDMMEDAPHVARRRMSLLDFAKATGRELALWTTNLTRGRGQALTLETHPGLDVVTAILASMAIPFIYQPVDVEGELMVDGAVTEFVPTSAFPAAPPGQVLQVSLPPRPSPPGPGLWRLAAAVFNAAMRHRAVGDGILSIDVPDVALDASDLSCVKFDVGPDTVWAQFRAGHAATREWLSSR